MPFISCLAQNGTSCGADSLDKKRTTEARLQIVTNVVVQIIIFLYLIDNNEQTSWMILMGSGVGTLIEAWKASPETHVIVVPA